MSSATIYGVGLGPGDPDLMSVKADRLLRQARHVGYFRKAGLKGRARTIVEDLIPAGAVEHAMEYPVTTEIPVADPAYNDLLSAFYTDCATRLRDLAQRGEDIVVLCEGDPSFYGSFMHLYTRLHAQVPVEIVPGITGMSAAWTATGRPVTWGDDVLTVLTGTLPEDCLSQKIADSDAVVVMKIGRNIAKVRAALERAGRLGDAWLVEFAAMPQQTVRRLKDVTVDVAPYFSIVILHGQGRRP